METLWVVGGGIESLPGIRRARELGLRVAVSDANPHAPGLAEADLPVVASTYDPDAVIAAAREHRAGGTEIAGVISVATDVPVTVAGLARALGLPGISLESARLASDKLAMKERLQADSVPVPEFIAVRDLAHLAREVARRGFPLVLKPVDSRGARGVLRLVEGVDLDWAYRTARAESPTGRVMLERYLAGPQISTESLVVDGVAHTPGFADRNYALLDRYAPHMIENGGSLPSALPASVRSRVGDVIQRCADSLGIRSGVVKGDIVVSGGRVFVIEVAARLSGGYLCSHLIPLHTGVDFVGAAIRQCLGERIAPGELTPRRALGVAQRYLFPEPGRVATIEGVEALRARPELSLVEVRVRVGDRVGPAHSHPARAGLVIATGADAPDACRAAESAVAALRIETTPLREVRASPAGAASRAG